MRKIINKRVYDTKTSQLLGHNVNGTWGDPEGYEEFLYKTTKGGYFIHGIGGTESKYPEEKIVVITEDEAKNF